jgi:hypothetical protein
MGTIFCVNDQRALSPDFHGVLMTIGYGQSGFDAALQRKGSSTTMKSETPEEIEARGFFEFLGYIVTRIPEARDGQRADYAIKDGTDRYIAEVKSRGPDQDFARQLQGPVRAKLP